MNPAPPSLFLGLDAGGTRTRALLVGDNGAVLGYGLGGSGNPNNLGLTGAVQGLAAAADAAWLAAGATRRPAAACFIGAAGIKAAGDCAELGTAAASAGLAEPSRCVAANDTEAALAGGLRGRPGIVLIAGTGSFCLGRNATGRTVRCGGWGWLLDDVGSGFFVGREALRATAFAGDGRGARSTLTDEVCDRFHLRDIDDLLAAVYTPAPTPASVADLAPLVLRTAAAGDPVARRILRDGAIGLAELVRRVASALTWDPAPEVVLVGGVARSGPPYQPLIETAIAAAIPSVKISAPSLPPVAGAALRALELGGVRLTTSVLDRLEADLAGRDIR